MFAVPGWSVSSDKLKAEQVQKTNSGPSLNKTKKRKRPEPGSDSVTSANVGDLWDSVVEGKPTSDSKKDQQAKRQKVKENSKKQKKNGTEGKPPVEEAVDASSTEQKPSKEKKKKNKQKDKKHQDSKPDGDEWTGISDDAAPTKGASTTSKPQASLPPPPKLTPLQASMREKLISARFRHLNETLYTKPSEEAYDLFQESPEMFDEYHEGFRRQVKVWPQNPVDRFLQDIRTRAKVKSGKGQSGADSSSRLSEAPLPRTRDTCTIADLGCGDAQLAESLQKDKSKLRIDVKSFDLQSPSPLVTKADIANLPLEDGSVNVAIFCLALMGTNWVDFIEEAFRILHWKGELWIAEIKSRFGPVRRNKNAPVTHSVGNRKKAGKGGRGGARDVEDDASNEQDLAVEVDGTDDRRQETDVSAFIEALRKRGFVLQGERNMAVDLSNRMFVKMHFIKGASPTKGKGVEARETAGRGRKGFGRKFEDVMNQDQEEPDEGGILKPCVYKIR